MTGARGKTKVGDRYGLLVVTGDAIPPARAGRCWRYPCDCDCGGATIVDGSALRSGGIRSCGCLGRVSRPRHGLSNSPTWHAYYNMVGRCSNRERWDWKHYGGRGIRISEDWTGPRGFDRFVADMGIRPEWALGGLDRIDNNGDYSKANCRWSTKSDQRRNQRPRTLTNDDVAEIRALGATTTRVELGRRFGVTRQHISHILNGRKWR
jgi:hypothetical protein